MLSRFKYDPVIVKNILFPGRDDVRLPLKKRRRIDNSSENTETAMDIQVDNTSRPFYPKTRPVILETPKESYLLSPSTPNGNSPHTYDIALILESELEEEPAPEMPAASILKISSTDLQLVQGTKDVLKALSGPDPANSGLHETMRDGLSLINGKGTTLSRPTDPTVQPMTIPTQSAPLSGSLSSEPLPRGASSNVLSTTATVKEGVAPEAPRADKVPDPTSLPEVIPSSRRTSLVYGDASKPLLLQTLQRNLGEDMFQFVNEGVKVADDLSEDGIQTNWMVQVRRWKWGPVMT